MGAPSGSIEWVLAVNLVIWTGLVIYMLRLGRKLRELEKKP
jgi:CcmD family protein